MLINCHYPVIFLHPIYRIYSTSRYFELMIQPRPTGKVFLICLLLLSVLSFPKGAFAQDAAAGKVLFQANCASCHAVHKEVTGPALAGIEERVPDQKLLHDWIRNNQKVLATGNPYFTELFNRYNKTPMNIFTNLGETDIENILAYVRAEESKKAAAPAEGPTGESPEAKAESSDNTLLYGILTLILAIIMLILLQVNSNLKKLSDDKEGVPAHEPVPFYRNKVYISLFVIVLFVIGGYFVIQGAIGLGRQQNYQPEQPIYYSHKVHAGANQISCLYCHGGAQDSKMAGVPSLNVCMNCHMAISEYSGSAGKLYREDGSEVNGTAEIEKLYEYTGWDPKAKKYVNPGKPIEWVKIHNLPDHVYFNHSQHVKAGQVQCQTCHGPIQEMGEVKQFAELSMGWCINCHRETKVQFTENKFYSIYEKFHNDLKNGKLDSVTVNDIGGTECQKCHY